MWATGTLGALVDGVRIGPLGMCGRSGIARAPARGRSGSPLWSVVQNLVWVIERGGREGERAEFDSRRGQKRGSRGG